jgi:ATP-dependent helicase/nuclease subunit B
MQFYYVDSELNYLSSISKWLIANHIHNFDSLQIFLPNGLLCQMLNQYLVQALGLKTRAQNFLLPKLIPLNNMEDHFLAITIDDRLCRPSQTTEQNLALANLILQREKLRIVDVVDMARQLNKNLQELAFKGLDLNKISEENVADTSIYLQKQLKALAFYAQELNQALKKQNKSTQHDFANEAIKKIYSDDSLKIFVGATRQSIIFNQVIAQNLHKSEDVFILPPLELDKFSYFEDSHKLLDFLKIDISKIKPLVTDISKIDTLKRTFSLEHFVAANETKVNFNHISLLETDNEIEEANLILLLIKDFIDKNPTAQLAVVTPNCTISKMIINNLQKFGIEFYDLIGESLMLHKLSQFIVCVADYMLDHNNIDKLLVCIKHPYIYSEHSLIIEKFVREHKFISKSEQISRYVQASNNEKLQKWWDHFLSPIKSAQQSLSTELQNLFHLFKTNLTIAEQIYPQIWNLEHDANTINFFHNLLIATNYIESIAKNQYVDLLTSILKQTNIVSTYQNKNVLLLSPDNALYLNFDLVILADMNESTWPNLHSSDLWLTNQLRNNLNLSDKDAEMRCKIHDFYLLLCNKKVIITRSKKVNNSLTSSSRLLQKLLALVDKHGHPNLNTMEQYLNFIRNQTNQSYNSLPQAALLVSSKNFPDSISVTSLELLMRNPYGFFARNILKLYQEKELNPDSMAAEFGTFIHQIISTYNSTYINENHLERFITIAKKTLEDADVNEFITNLWWPKISNLAQEYVEFDIKRRQHINHIYSEIYGEIIIDLGIRQQKITAIADEIVTTKLGKAYILDYKTGLVPSKKDVLSGLSPQLVLEGLILQRGGFKNIPKHEVEKIVFIKLASSEPYLTEIVISDIDFQQQYEGLENLLMHYCQDATYNVSPHEEYAPLYDNYKHLGRKNS